MTPFRLWSACAALALAAPAHADDAPAESRSPDSPDADGRTQSAPRLRLSGFAQVDWTIFNQASEDEVDFSTNQPINQDRFVLRRGHLRVESAQGMISAALEVDANTVSGPQVRPIDAEVGLRWPPPGDERDVDLTASAGLLKIPFGFEVPELDSIRPFLERATVLRALFPGEYDLGARLRLRYRFLDWTIAAMNGSPIGDKVFPALAPGRTKEIVGRLGVRAEVTAAVRVEAGLSADAGSGFHVGTPTTKSELVWRDENGDGIVQATEIQVIPGSSSSPSQGFRRFAVGADLRFFAHLPVLGDLTVRAEIVRGQNLDRGLETADPIGAGHDLREFGWSVGVTQEVTSWALVGARYDRYDPDDDASRQQAAELVPADRTYSTLALLAMLRFQTARLSLEFDKNGNALGVAANGAPTTLNDDALTLRAQVTF